MVFQKVPNSKHVSYELKTSEDIVVLKHSNYKEKKWAIPLVAKLSKMNYEKRQNYIKKLTKGMSGKSQAATALNQFIKAVKHGHIKINGFDMAEVIAKTRRDNFNTFIKQARNRGLGTIKTSPEKMDKVVEVWNQTHSMTQVKKQAHVSHITANKILKLRKVVV